MKITLYMAISVDGYIAKADYSTDWVFDSDFKMFEKKIEESDAIIVGKTTFEEIGVSAGVKNIVLTKGANKDLKENVIYVNDVNNIQDILQHEQLGNVLIVGGGICNGSLLENNLVNEVVVSIHPVILGKGIKLFENIECEEKLELIETKKFDDGLVHLHYKIKKD